LSSRAQRELYKNIPVDLTLPHRNDCEAELGERYQNKPPIISSSQGRLSNRAWREIQGHTTQDAVTLPHRKDCHAHSFSAFILIDHHHTQCYF